MSETILQWLLDVMFPFDLLLIWVGLHIMGGVALYRLWKRRRG